MVENKVMVGILTGSPNDLPKVVKVRETLEETAWRIRPKALVGLHQWTSPRDGRSFLRICFAGDPVEQECRRLDSGIRRACWLSRAELVEHSDRLRSPMVLRCIDDYLAGKRFSLDLLADLDDRS